MPFVSKITGGSNGHQKVTKKSTKAYAVMPIMMPAMVASSAQMTKTMNNTILAQNMPKIP